jgi:hypothetical protein
MGIGWFQRRSCPYVERRVEGTVERSGIQDLYRYLAWVFVSSPVHMSGLIYTFTDEEEPRYGRPPRADRYAELKRIKRYV